MADNQHGHQIFRRFRGYTGPLPAGIQCGWLGDMYRPEWLNLAPTPAIQAVEPPAPSPTDEEYFEWIGLLEAVAAARYQFVMFELGAGFGKWGVRGALAAMQMGFDPGSIRITFVEAEPSHAAWLREALAINPGVAGISATMVEAAVSGSDGEVFFATGHEREWYGQQITVPGTDYSPWGFGDTKIVSVNAISLQTLLRDAERVDLIDMDIQGSETEVVRASLDPLCAKVLRLEIETHSAQIDDELPRLLEGRGWCCVFRYPCYQPSKTPYGVIPFDGGRQYWVNSGLLGSATGRLRARAFRLIRGLQRSDSSLG